VGDGEGTARCDIPIGAIREISAASSSRRPRIDQRNRNILKVCRIASSQCSVLGHDDTGDDRLAQFAGATLLVAGCRQVASLLRGGCVKRDDSVADFSKNFFKCLHELRLAPSDSHDLQAESNFKDRH